MPAPNGDMHASAIIRMIGADDYNRGRRHIARGHRGRGQHDTLHEAIQEDHTPTASTMNHWVRHAIVRSPSRLCVSDGGTSHSPDRSGTPIHHLFWYIPCHASRSMLRRREKPPGGVHHTHGPHQPGALGALSSEV
jgi:hypothetical protein